MQFMGFDGFIWFTGVVEDRHDPMKLGRVRVRIAGLHTEVRELGLTEGIPVEELPWAHPMQPLTSAAMNGIGTTPLGPVEGTWVVGFFRDGENAQEPVVIGTLGGVPYEPPKPIGFHDPNLFYPKETHLIEPDTYRRARPTGFIEPRGGAKKESKPTPLDDRAIDMIEPGNPFNALYPFNHTRVSESGHVEEWDDTPENTRLMRWHKSGTFEEIREDGTRVRKVVGDNYSITLGNDFVHIHGNLEVTVDGDYNLLVGGDYNVVVLHGGMTVNGGAVVVAGESGMTTADAMDSGLDYLNDPTLSDYLKTAMDKLKAKLAEAGVEVDVSGVIPAAEEAAADVKARIADAKEGITRAKAKISAAVTTFTSWWNS